MPRLLIVAGVAAILAATGAPARAQVQPTSPVPSKSYVDIGLAAVNSAVAAEVTRAQAAEAGLMPLPSILPACTAGSSVAPVPTGQPFRCGGLILIAQ